MPPDNSGIVWAEPDRSSPLFKAVRELGDASAKTVGHLPFAAWDDYASRRHILVAINSASDGDEQMMGYTAYRLPRDEVVVAQLVVHPSHRGKGVARAIVQELSKRYESRRGIRLRCRRDFAVNNLWPQLGFISRGERPGRQKSGSILTEWWRDHGHLDLMSWQGSPPHIIPVLIDSNVFFDLHVEADAHDRQDIETLKTLDGDRIDIIFSPETFNEIQRNKSKMHRDRLVSIANSYPHLTVSPSVVQEWEARLRSLVDRPIVRPQDISDLRHVAYALSGGIEVLVTRDRPARHRFEGVADKLGLRVTTVDEVVPLIDAQENRPAYAPQALLGTEFKLFEMTADHRALVAHLLANESGERRTELDATLDGLARGRPLSTRSLLTDPNGDAIAVVGAIPVGRLLEVPLLRLAATALEETIAAQLVNQLRTLANAAGSQVVRVVDRHCGPVLARALEEDGFFPTGQSWTGVTLCGAYSRLQTAEFLTGIASEHQLRSLDTFVAWLNADAPSPYQAQAMEHRFRPLRLLDVDLPTFIVPIRDKYSSDLFGYPQHLFSRPDHLGISLEHVYYRAGKSNESAPARLLWYLSGDKYSEVFACSTLVDVVDANAKDLYRRYRRLGVYTYADVAEAASSTGEARALHVIDTHVFPTPVNGRMLRSSYARHRQPFSVQWPTLLQQDLATDLLVRGFDDRGA